jgi:hypothetical protein
MVDRWGPKHVELTYVMNKTQSLKNIVYLVGLHIYYKMTHGPCNIKLTRYSLLNWAEMRYSVKLPLHEHFCHTLVQYIKRQTEEWKLILHLFSFTSQHKIKVYAIKACGWLKVRLYSILTSALDGFQKAPNSPATLPPGKNSDTH